MDVFQKLGLVEVMDDGAIYMLQIQNFIGKSSTEAEWLVLDDLGTEKVTEWSNGILYSILNKHTKQKRKTKT